MNRYRFFDSYFPDQQVIVEAVNELAARESFAAHFLDRESWAAAAAEGLCDGVSVAQAPAHEAVTQFPCLDLAAEDPDKLREQLNFRELSKGEIEALTGGDDILMSVESEVEGVETLRKPAIVPEFVAPQVPVLDGSVELPAVEGEALKMLSGDEVVSLAAGNGMMGEETVLYVPDHGIDGTGQLGR